MTKTFKEIQDEFNKDINNMILAVIRNRFLIILEESNEYSALSQTKLKSKKDELAKLEGTIKIMEIEKYTNEMMKENQQAREDRLIALADIDKLSNIKEKLTSVHALKDSNDYLNYITSEFNDESVRFFLDPSYNKSVISSKEIELVTKTWERMQTHLNEVSRLLIEQQIIEEQKQQVENSDGISNQVSGSDDVLRYTSNPDQIQKLNNITIEEYEELENVYSDYSNGNNNDLSSAEQSEDTEEPFMDTEESETEEIESNEVNSEVDEVSEIKEEVSQLKLDHNLHPSTVSELEKFWRSKDEANKQEAYSVNEQNIKANNFPATDTDVVFSQNQNTFFTKQNIDAQKTIACEVLIKHPDELRHDNWLSWFLSPLFNYVRPKTDTATTKLVEEKKIDSKPIQSDLATAYWAHRG